MKSNLWREQQTRSQKVILDMLMGTPVWQLEYFRRCSLPSHARSDGNRATCSYVLRNATDAPNVTRMSAIPRSVFLSFYFGAFISADMPLPLPFPCHPFLTSSNLTSAVPCLRSAFSAKAAGVQRSTVSVRS